MTFSAFFKSALLVAGLGFLAACEPIPQQGTPCPSELTCQLAQAVAQDIDRERGRDFAPGFKLSRAVAIGPTVLMDIKVGLDQAIIPADERAEVKKIAAAAFAEGVCEGDSRDVQTFFDVAGGFRLRLLDVNRVTFVDVVLQSCRGG